MLKEATEVLALGQELATALTSAKADGHVDWMDLPKFAPVIGKAKAAIDGSEKIASEFSTASQEDLVVFAQHALEVAMALVAAVIAPRAK
jgi:hypothetical protein